MSFLKNIFCKKEHANDAEKQQNALNIIQNGMKSNEAIKRVCIEPEEKERIYASMQRAGHSIEEINAYIQSEEEREYEGFGSYRIN